MRRLFTAVLKALKAEQDLAGETVLITAGPTREPIDPVRYIGNRSSGKMGYALAEAALRRGAKVILISGPTALKPPSSAEVIQVQTAQQMRDAVMAHFERATIVIKAAAVADFTVRAADEKIKRKGSMTLELEPTTDILAELGAKKGSRIIVGFAAETTDVLANARKKLESKALDAIVLNDVSQPGIGFDSERNAVTILTHAGAETVPETSKWEVAHRVLDAVVKLKAEKNACVQRNSVSSWAHPECNSMTMRILEATLLLVKAQVPGPGVSQMANRFQPGAKTDKQSKPCDNPRLNTAVSS